MKPIKRIFVGLFFLLLLGAMSSATPVMASMTAIPNPTQYIRETANISPDPLDPASNYESFGSGINEHVAEGLVNYVGNSATELEGILATSWSVSADGLQYNFTLRENVTFHDGTPFNAYVMKYSLDRAIIMMDDWGPAWMLAYVNGGLAYEGMAFSPGDVNVSEAKDYLDQGGVIALDEYELQLNLPDPFSPMLTALAYRVGCAVSPNATITNRPSVANPNVNDVFYTTDEADNATGMVPLDYWFNTGGTGPLTDAEICTYLGLSAGHDMGDSGVVPFSGQYQDNTHSWMATHAIGTGPYKLTDLTPGAAGQVKFDKNDDWWGWDAGKGEANSPDEILIKGVAEVETRVLDLLSGDADHIYVPTSHADEVIDIDKWLNDGVIDPVDGVNVLTGPTFTINFMGMNFNDTLPSQYMWTNPSTSTYNATHGFGSTNVTHPNGEAWAKWGPDNDNALLENASQGNPFTAREFRKAVAMSFDHTTYIQQTSNGFGERMEGVIPNGMFAHQDHLIDDGLIPSFNPDAAKALFEAVGWKGTFWLFYNTGNLNRKAACLMLKNTIESYGIGIQVVVQEQIWSTYLSTIRAREPPIFNLGWLPDYADPDNYASPFASSTGTYPYRMSYENPDVDILVNAAAINTNATEREEQYQMIEEYVASDYAFIYIMQAKRFTVLGDWIYPDVYSDSGSLNPMCSWHFTWNIYKQEPPVPTTPTTTTTTVTTTTTTTTEEPEPGPSPGFELLATLSVLIAATVVIRRRR
jgi:peptide/nickel transport system substrate-binding protein